MCKYAENVGSNKNFSHKGSTSINRKEYRGNDKIVTVSFTARDCV